MIRITISAAAFLALSPLLGAQSGQASRLYEYSGANGDHMGSAVAELSDIDGDGAPDYAVASIGANNGRGQVQVISGSRGTQLYTVDGAAAGDRFGQGVDGLPDINGDGIDDLVIGAPLATGATAGCGRVYVRSGRDGSAIFTKDGAGANDHMGWSVASLGDLDGDGVAEFAGGAIDDDNFGSSSGSVRVWSGATGATLFNLYGAAGNQLFGHDLTRLGDWNNDGVSDFAVGAPSIAGTAATGYVRVFSGLDQTVLRSLNGLNSGDNFGSSLATPGDLDHDGRADLAVGSPQVSPASTGQVDVFLAAGGPALWRVFGVGIADRFGAALAAAGDVNQDGTDDFVVGAPGADLIGAVDTGSLTCFSGAAGSVLWTRFGQDFGRPLGAAIAGSGDVNQDGSPDLVAGCPGNLALPSEKGGALVISTQPMPFFASDFLVRLSLPQQPVLTIDMGPAFAQHDYRILGSITGLSPKTPFGGVLVPLVVDRYLRHTSAASTNALLSAPTGQLDGAGRAQVSFTPTQALLSAGYLGLTFYHAAVILDAQGQAVAASNPLPVTMVP